MGSGTAAYIYVDLDLAVLDDENHLAILLLLQHSPSSQKNTKPHNARPFADRIFDIVGPVRRRNRHPGSRWKARRVPSS